MLSETYFADLVLGRSYILKSHIDVDPPKDQICPVYFRLVAHFVVMKNHLATWQIAMGVHIWMLENLIIRALCRTFKIQFVPNQIL